MTAPWAVTVPGKMESAANARRGAGGFGRSARAQRDRLLGATDGFVRRPFLYFGALQGLAGGLALAGSLLIATSLSMAPAMIVAQHARVVDLDGPLLLAKDRENGLRYDGSTVYPPDAALWG